MLFDEPIDADFSPDQRSLLAALDRLLARSAPLELTRAYSKGDHACAEPLAEAFKAFGGASLLVPEAYGGGELGLIEAAIVAHAIGRHTAALAFSGRYALAPLALGGCANEAARQRWLPAIAAGQARIAVSLRANPGLRAEGGHLSGPAEFIVEAPDCDALILRDHEGRLHLVATQAGLRFTELITLDRTRRVASAELRNAQAEPLNLDGAAFAHLQAAERLLIAADTLGACESLVRRAVAHALERKQFGRIIGSFQAIKHLCADMAAEMDLAQSLLWRATASLAARAEDASLLCAQAKTHLDEVGRMIARGTVEVHGAMGFAAMSGVHFWTKRIALNRTIAGAPEKLRREIVGMMLAPV